MAIDIDATFHLSHVASASDIVPVASRILGREIRDHRERRRLEWQTIDVLERAVRAFLDPVLASVAAGTWSPEAWAWRQP